MKANMKIILTIVFFCMLITACDKQEEVVDPTQKAGKPVVKVDDTGLLARVNDTRITEDDLNIIIRRTLGRDYAGNLNREQKAKFLESAIKSRAMALAAKKELDPGRSQEIKLSVAAYKEELLAKDYLRNHATPKPLTSTRIEEFYNNNQELFGARVTRVVQQISAARNQKKASNISALMSQLREHENWGESARENEQITLRQFTYRKGLLGKQQEKVISQLKTGATSSVHMINNEFYVFRVISEQKTEAQPLSQVAGKVREYLLPQLIGEAVEQVSGELMKTTKVERIREPG
jgi:hypothetical protein